MCLGRVSWVSYARRLRCACGAPALHPGWSFGTVSACVVIDLVRNRVFGVCVGLFSNYKYSK